MVPGLPVRQNIERVLGEHVRKRVEVGRKAVLVLRGGVLGFRFGEALRDGGRGADELCFRRQRGVPHAVVLLDPFGGVHVFRVATQEVDGLVLVFDVLDGNCRSSGGGLRGLRNLGGWGELHDTRKGAGACSLQPTAVLDGGGVAGRAGGGAPGHLHLVRRPVDLRVVEPEPTYAEDHVVLSKAGDGELGALRMALVPDDDLRNVGHGAGLVEGSVDVVHGDGVQEPPSRKPRLGDEGRVEVAHGGGSGVGQDVGGDRGSVRGRLQFDLERQAGREDRRVGDDEPFRKSLLHLRGLRSSRKLDEVNLRNLGGRRGSLRLGCGRGSVR